MSRRSQREYVATQRSRYRRGTRAEKHRILDEGCQLFGVHRKSLIRAFGRKTRRATRRAGRGRQYAPATLREPLKRIWLAAEQPCGKRLHALLPDWLPHYERHYGPLEPPVRDALLAASPATLDRLLEPLRARRKGLSGTRATARLQGQIPIRTNFRDVQGPGTVEADTVAHCGMSLAGQFVWTLTLTDIWSGWTESRAVWNKSASQIRTRLRDIEQRLAFDIVAFDTDNGSEFINHILYRYFHERATPVHMTRSRPYRKNDQAHIEQKQWTHVRQLLGYDRFEDRRLVARINDLLANEWRDLQNHFLPTMQLRSKTREGGKIRRQYGKPLTPYERLIHSDILSEDQKTQLRQEHERLDPFVLQKAIETKLAAIFRLVRAQRKPPAKTASNPRTPKRRKGAKKAAIAA